MSTHAGYTHYFTWNQKPGDAALKECIKDMALVIQARRDLVAGPDGTNAMILSATNLDFNGIGDNAHEPFVFPGEVGFNFCKTEWKPYDEVVTACLLVARDHFPPSVLTIDSDGAWEGGDWDAGTKLYKSVFNRRAHNPMRRLVPGFGLSDPSGRRVAQVVLVGIAVFILWRWKTSKEF